MLVSVVVPSIHCLLFFPPLSQACTDWLAGQMTAAAGVAGAYGSDTSTGGRVGANAQGQAGKQVRTQHQRARHAPPTVMTAVDDAQNDAVRRTRTVVNAAREAPDAPPPLLRVVSGKRIPKPLKPVDYDDL